MTRGTPKLSWAATETKLARANAFYPRVLYYIKIRFACVVAVKLPLLYEIHQILKGRLK